MNTINIIIILLLLIPIIYIVYNYYQKQNTNTNSNNACQGDQCIKTIKCGVLSSNTIKKCDDNSSICESCQCTSDPNVRQNCMSCTKVDQNNKYNVDIRIVRIFNTYGPRMAKNDGRVVSNFIVQALKGQDITIYGTGQQTRSFCYVDDLLDAMQAMMNHNDDEFIGPVNIGNPGEFTMWELAEKVIELTGSKSRIVQFPLPKDDPRQRRPDITQAKEMLNWEPKINLEQGLINTIDYFRKVV
jgi:UDP-glucose 4-epimerase